jgi:chemotaxis protein MotB
MTKLHLFVFSIFAMAIVLPGCVTQAEHAEVKDQLTYFKKQSIAADSVAVQNRKLQQENQNLADDYGLVVREMEDLKAANINLHRSYAEVLDRLNLLKYENDEVIAASSYENVGLQESVAEMRARLDAKERELAKMEYELYQKETRLNNQGGGFSDSGGDYPSEADYKLKEIEGIVANNRAKMSAVAQSISNSLAGYSPNQANLKAVNDKLHIVLGYDLLFSEGEEDVSWDGKTALRQITTVLAKNRDLGIEVVGHTSSDGIASRNWEISVNRATKVANLLASYGIAPESITASGRGFYEPVASNLSLDGRKQNNRTEIILSANWDELFKILNR